MPGARRLQRPVDPRTPSTHTARHMNPPLAQPRGRRTRRSARPSRRARQRRGLTRIEALALISAGAVVAAVTVPTFLRELRLSKLAEAHGELERLYQAAAAYHGSVQRTPTGPRTRCIPDSAGPVPPTPGPTPSPGPTRTTRRT